MVTIYVLKDPRNNEIRYCGQTSNKLSSRLYRHILTSFKKEGKLTHKESWIRSLGGISPIIEKIDECEENESDALEISYIKKFRENGYRLTNLAEGGKGVVLKGKYHPNWGKHLSEETKRKIGASNSGNKNGMFQKGKPFSKDRKEKMSFIMKSSLAIKNRGDAWKMKISKAQSVDIEIISSSSGKVIFVFENARIASKTLGCTRANLTNAARFHRKIGKKMKSLKEECYVIYRKPN